MDEPRKFSVREIRRHYTGQKAILEKQNYGFFFRKIIRPISFYLTPPFLFLGFSANQVTLLSLLTGLIGCGLLISGHYYFMLAGTVFLLSFLMLDFIDGNIARFHGKTNHFGKFLDGVSGTVIYTLIPICLGLGAGNKSHGNDFLHISSETSIILGFFSGYVFTFCFYIQWRFRAQKSSLAPIDGSDHTAKEQKITGESIDNVHPLNQSSGFKSRIKQAALTFLHRIYLVWQNFYIPSLFLLAVPGLTDFTLLLICAINAIYSVSYILYTLYNAMTILDRYRSY